MVGLLAFLTAHAFEFLTWNLWFGGAHQPWFLNSGRAMAATTAWLFTMSLIGGAVELSGLMFSAGAFIAMTGVLLLEKGGPGNIFPIVMAFGAVFIGFSGLLGAWIGREIAGLVRRRL